MTHMTHKQASVAAEPRAVTPATCKIFVSELSLTYWKSGRDMVSRRGSRIRRQLVDPPSASRFLLLLFAFSMAVVGSGQQEEAVIDPQGGVTTGSSSTTSKQHQDGTLETKHGVDESWPMHYHFDESSSPQAKIYKQYIQGCEEKAQHCDQFESDRMEMNLQQPPAMDNYTYAGYAKVFTPTHVQDMLTQLWNEKQHEAVVELWDPSNTYVNHWEVPTRMLDIKQHLSEEQLWTIIKAVQPIMESWTGQSLILTSIYGIRAYYKGAILAPHVDRLPLVSSCIIHVASSSSSSQKQEEEGTSSDPWILEVIDHHGQAHNVSMDPGDMVLYESHSVIHGRPYPLQGDHYANIFLHFEPIGHTRKHAEKGAYGTDVQLPEQAERAYEQALAKAQQQQQESSVSEKKRSSSAPSSVPDLPNYVSPTLASSWKQNFHFERNEIVSPKPTKQTLGLLTSHLAASDGLLDVLKEISAKDRSQLFKADSNGWRPLHEAARGGRADVVEYLLKEGEYCIII
jgi:prolyl 4-hydroxylase